MMNAHYMRVGFAVAILLCPRSTESGGGDGKKTIEAYTAQLRDIEGALYLPAFVPTAGQTIYRNPVCGLSIDSVIVDGVNVSARDYDVDFDDFDLSVLRPAHDIHGYQLVIPAENDDDRMYYQLLAIIHMQKNDYTFVEYRIPLAATKITIRYRPRYPLNQLGTPLTLLAEK